MTERVALVIEDDEAIAWFMGIALRDTPYVVEMIRDGQAALDRLAQDKPALVILDLNLPYVSGVEVLRTIRQDPRLADLIVIVVSANPHMAGPIDDLADVVLQKPVSYDQIHTLIQRFA